MDIIYTQNSHFLYQKIVLTTMIQMNQTCWLISHSHSGHTGKYIAYISKFIQKYRCMRKLSDTTSSWENMSVCVWLCLLMLTNNMNRSKSFWIKKKKMLVECQCKFFWNATFRSLHMVLNKCIHKICQELSCPTHRKVVKKSNWNCHIQDLPLIQNS